MASSVNCPKCLGRRAIALVVLMAVTAAFGPVVAASAHSTGPVASGALAFVRRADLPEGLGTLVSDETLTAANAPVFAKARAAWPSDAEFVAQLDYQHDYRSRVDYLDTTDSYLAQLLTERPVNFGIEVLGLYLSDTEVAEMQRRSALGDRMDAVVEAVTLVDDTRTPEGEPVEYGPLFAGIMQDQQDGGRIVLALTDTKAVNIAELENIVGGADKLRIVEQGFSYDETEAFRDQLEEELSRLGIDRNVTAVWSGAGRNLEVHVEDPGRLPVEFGAGLPEGAFVVRQGEPVRDASAPDELHSFADQQPGLRVQVAITDGPDGICTWGHNGHTASYHYIVMAGHCFENHQNTSGQWVGEVINLWQDGSSSRNITPGDSYLVSIKNASYDTARIESSYANDNCYHGPGNQQVSGHCQYKMANRASHNSWEVGSDQSCASLGNSGVYKCGYITEEGHGTDDTVGVGMSVIGGDSGSGMIWITRIDGILSGSVPGTAFFQSAFRVKDSLGFDFNCRSGLLTTNDPSVWGACPVVDA